MTQCAFGSMLFSLRVFAYALGIPELLTSNFIPLGSEKLHGMILARSNC